MPSTLTPAQARPVARATPSSWAWVRVLGGVCVLALLVWQVGTGPFLDGVRVIDGSALVAASAIGALTTVCCAWRWRVVAAGLGVRLPLAAAIAAYYRSQFLNTTLPGGVLGDVHRAVRHGQHIGDVGLGVRAVVLERLAGQTVLVGVAVIVLFVFPSPVRSHMPVATAGLLVAGLGVVVVARTLARVGAYRWMRALGTAGSDIRADLFSGRNWVSVALTSCLVVAGHLTVFLLAARIAGASAPLMLLMPLTLLALLAMGLPANVAGWGPREGMAAWAFSAAGLTAAQGVTTAVTYGVLTLIASLPGAAALLLRWASPEPDTHHPTDPAQSPVPVLRQGGPRE